MSALTWSAAFATLPPPGEASQGFWAEDADELVREPGLESVLGRLRGARLASLLPARREDRVRELQDVRLSRTVLAHEHVQVLPKVEIRLAEDGKILDMK